MLDILAANPILTLFLAIGLGYLIGNLSLRGVRLGPAGVLFAGLAIGSLSSRIAIPEVIPSLGLIIFVYSIGIQTGPVFFDSFRRQGLRNTLFAVAVLLLGALLTIALAYWLPLPAARAAGLYAGALTNTPALAAAQERAQELAAQANLSPSSARKVADDATLAYSIAYPFGVLGVILSFILTRRLWRAEIPPEVDSEILVRDFAVRNPGVVGHTIAELRRVHGELGFVISRIQRQGEIHLARPDMTLQFGDVLAVVGDARSLERAEQIFGEEADARIEQDRTKLDYRRVFVSSPQVVGKRIGDLQLETRHNCTITRLRRGDVDIVPSADTILEYGDRVRVLTERANFDAVRKLFGDSIRGIAETDFGSVALGMVLGVLLGSVPLPLPGGAVVKLGLAGGPLIVALILGKLRHTGQLDWSIPAGAALTLRNLGLVLFLAAAGLRAGYSFLATLRQNGLQLLAAGALITLAVALLTLWWGRRFGAPFDELMGLTAGIHTQPACLAYALDTAQTERPNAGYASVYPAAMIAKIVLVQLLVSLLPR